MKKIFSTLCVLMAISAFGQGNDQVNIHSQGNRDVEPAFRKAGTPRIIDTTIQTSTVNYPLLSLKYETTTQLEQINPAAIKVNPTLDPLYRTYVKLGVGTELMPLGEIYFNSKRSRKFIFGAHLKHLSSFGNISHYAPAQFDRTRFGFDGGIHERKYDLTGDIHYNNQGLHYYGASDTLGLLKDSIAQRYSDFGIGGKFIGHSKDSANFNYFIGLNYNNYLSKKPERAEDENWRAKENFFGLRAGGWYKLGKETYALDLDVLYNGYRYGLLGTSLAGLDTGKLLNNTVVSLKPYITTHLQDNRFRAKIGLDVTIDGHTVNRAYVYPMAEVKYSMFNDIFIPYVGIRGGMKQTSFKSLTQTNEFLLPNVNLQNENTRYDIYGGIKGTLSKRVYFNAGAGFALVQNKALFITDTIHSVGNKFDVIYDTVKVATIEASIGYQLKEKIKIEGIGRYYSYEAMNNSYAWNLPRMQFIIRGSYNLYDKLLFNLDVNLEEGRKALVYEPGEDITEENGQYILDLGFIADANISVEYRYNKRISAFVQCNNLASQGYMRWYNAPVQRFQFLGGLTFRF